MKHIVVKDISLSIAMEVEAETAAAAQIAVGRAWEENQTFVNKVLTSALIEDSETYVPVEQDPRCYREVCDFQGLLS